VGWNRFWSLRIVASPTGISIHRRFFLNRRLSLPIRKIEIGSIRTRLGGSINSSTDDSYVFNDGGTKKDGMYLRLRLTSGSITLRSKIGLSHFKRQWDKACYTESRQKTIVPDLSSVVTLKADDFLRLQLWLQGRGELKPRHFSPG
jgi:hypothetical protein